jgi:hypothetical protein
MRLYNQEYWEIADLELTNNDAANVRERFGVWVAAEDTGTLHHLHVLRVDVHDVNGLLDDSHKANGGIIFDIRGNHVETRWDDALVEGCTVRAVDRSGIWFASYWWDRNLANTDPHHWVGSTNVVIRNNSVDDCGGDGIVPCMCTGPLVEYNVAKDCNTRSGRYCVAIWPWSCDDAVIQYNEAYLTRTTRDGEGFDSDWFSRNTVIQYNYSHDNEGGFCLICSKGDYNGFNDGTIVRYNISQNDQTRSFHIAGPCTNTSVYNNTIYIGEGMDVDPIRHTSWYGYADGTHFYNNIFYHLGTGDYELGSSTSNVFDYNVFYGSHPASEPADPHKLTEDPGFRLPFPGGIGRDTCHVYKLRPDSPCIDTGVPIPDNGGLDFWGNPVPSGAAPDRGAHEFRQDPSPCVLTVTSVPVTRVDVMVDPPDVEARFYEWTDRAFTYEYGETVSISVPGRAAFRPFAYWDVDGVTEAAEVADHFAGITLAMDDDHVVTAHYDEPESFPDVPEDHWAYAEVMSCWTVYIVEGYPDGLYRPELVVTRDQMAVFIARAMAGRPEPSDEPTFPDVPSDHWAYESVEEAAGENVVEGYPDGNYHPDWQVTRGQMAVFIARALASPRGEEGLADYEPPAEPTFPDVPSDYWCYRHVEYIACGEAYCVVEGYPDGNYRPTWPVTRDQMAVYVRRAFLGWRG